MKSFSAPNNNGRKIRLLADWFSFIPVRPCIDFLDTYHQAATVSCQKKAAHSSEKKEKKTEKRI